MQINQEMNPQRALAKQMTAMIKIKEWTLNAVRTKLYALQSKTELNAVLQAKEDNTENNFIPDVHGNLMKEDCYLKPRLWHCRHST